MLQNKIIANCFFEPSTRTRLSFEAAALRLGANVIGFADAGNTSQAKGESLQDTIKVISSYSDLLIIRHPKEGAARLAADVSDKPVINAGDASNQHPTQALIDLFTIYESQSKLEGINIAIIGDLKHGRAVHSLVQACALFDMRLFFVSPRELSLPEYLTDYIKNKMIKFSFHQNIEEVISRVDILYMTRIQRERFDGSANISSKEYILTPKMLANVKDNLKIMHPLPRVKEIDRDIDQMPYAYYFTQAENGLYVRQTLLSLILNG